MSLASEAEALFVKLGKHSCLASVSSGVAQYMAPYRRQQMSTRAKVGISYRLRFGYIRRALHFGKVQEHPLVVCFSLA